MIGVHLDPAHMVPDKVSFTHSCAILEFAPRGSGNHSFDLGRRHTRHRPCLVGLTVEEGERHVIAVLQSLRADMARGPQMNPLGLLRNDDDLAILGYVAEGGLAADPETLALGGGDLVADALGGDLALELGK